MMAVLTHVEIPHTVVLIFISHVTGDVQHLFMYLLAIYFLFGKVFVQAPCPLLNKIVYLLLLNCMSILYILEKGFQTVERDVSSGFLLNGLYCSEVYSLYTQFVKEFYHEGMYFVKCFYCIC